MNTQDWISLFKPGALAVAADKWPLGAQPFALDLKSNDKGLLICGDGRTVRIFPPEWNDTPKSMLLQAYPAAVTAAVEAIINGFDENGNYKGEQWNERRALEQKEH